MHLASIEDGTSRLEALLEESSDKSSSGKDTDTEYGEVEDGNGDEMLIGNVSVDVVKPSDGMVKEPYRYFTFSSTTW
jgi:hypothetical protein